MLSLVFPKKSKVILDTTFVSDMFCIQFLYYMSSLIDIAYLVVFGN